MSRIRTVKPEFWAHEELSALPESTHILAAALLNYADDFGFFNANPGLIRASCFPLREPSVSIPESLRSLQTIGFLRLGKDEKGKQCGHIIKFCEHQRVSHPTPTKFDDKSIVWDISGDIPENIGKPPDIFVPERKGKEGNREGSVLAKANTVASATNGSGNGHTDPTKILFDAGVQILTNAGRTDASARAIIGKWRKQVGDDAALMSIIAAATTKSAVDPVGYITAAIKSKKEGPPLGRAWA